jgi:hypothetical protein
MRKILFLMLVVFFASMPFLGQSEETGVSVHTPGGSFEVRTGDSEEPPEKRDVVVVEKTVVQPKAGGCSCRLDSGGFGK